MVAAAAPACSMLAAATIKRADRAGGGIFGGGGRDAISRRRHRRERFLWRASLDTLNFMPLESADPFGGIIITGWHQTHHPGRALQGHRLYP